MGVETNRTVLQEEIEKLDGFGYHTYVISGEHHQNNSPKNPEVIRRIAQILLEVFHIVKSRRRGIAHLTWMFKTWKVLGQVIHQYGWYFWTWVVANLGLVFLFFSKKRNEGLQSDHPSVQDESK
ncbi:hypothetical protein C9374_006039 [Naegleria lovaniensis]|uniref:Uncharacterized protein n=1 Tax=Naegleria lovaniensis TaxID=51637 RepID=A0AA88GK73_NAELO|nr:uncharacterized protein C9374_006039 [Naegleria lovaniensis]KAG2381655.1 hypothetical protein C9374_006039 [Naegleria lovaniensis]